MNSDFKTTTQLANIQLSEPSRLLPEQTPVLPVSVPRPISFLSIIYQWQPMGIRVVADLPFVSDDSSPLFCIRNGPFIADWREGWWDSKGHSIAVGAFNMLNGVILSPLGGAFVQNFPVHIAYYDSPPLLSQLSRMFRRWRGDMQYRIRVVAGFVTQGYLIIAPIKNTSKSLNKFDEYSFQSTLQVTDNLSFRAYMQNAYVMSDTSMYRHVEVTYPYEYPTPWYDQYQWMENRVNLELIEKDDPHNNTFKTYTFYEPFADNWLGVFFRGALEPTRDSSQITFELEYRAVEGFQFSDPGLLPQNFHYTTSALWDDNLLSFPFTVKVVPSKNFKSNGIDKIWALSPSTKSQQDTTKTIETQTEFSPYSEITGKRLIQLRKSLEAPSRFEDDVLVPPENLPHGGDRFLESLLTRSQVKEGSNQQRVKRVDDETGEVSNDTPPQASIKDPTISKEPDAPPVRGRRALEFNYW